MAVSARLRAQSLVELGLLAPVLLLLLGLTVDVGRAFSTWVVLHNAAREGANVASWNFSGSTSNATIVAAVVREGAGVGVVPSQVGIAYSAGGDIVDVTVVQPFQPLTPLVHSVLGSISITGRADFPVRVRPTTPPTVQPSTPLPTTTPVATSTPTPTNTPTNTPTPTPTPQTTCNLYPPATQPIPALASGSGFWCRVTLTAPNNIGVAWADNQDPNNQLLIYSGNPFAGQTDPVATPPPGGAVSVSGRYRGVFWAVTQGCQPPGTYAVYFYDGGAPVPTSTTGWVTTYTNGC